ncbi:MAG: hypothetical protein ACM37W_24340 [Actinomycetota bacterium]
MKKSGLLNLAILFLLSGGVAAFASGKIACVLTECILVTEGKDIFTARGIKLDQGTAELIKQSPLVLFGVGGAFLVAGLVKQNEIGSK